MRGIHTTAEKMAKVWTLHQQRVDETTIAAVMDISKKSVNRIITIFELTEKRDFEAIDSFCGDKKLQNIRDCALEFFGISSPVIVHEEKPKDAKVDADATNTAAWLIEVLELMREQNALLKEITEMWK